MYDDPLSQRLLRQIETFSERLLVRLGLPAAGSPHGGLQPFRPIGTVLHFTADPSIESVLRWFCYPNSLTSSHFVVGQGRHRYHEELTYDLPDVAALPSTVVAMRSLKSQAWHATWTNKWAFGIEVCNVGELRVGPEGTLGPVADARYDPNIAPVLPSGQRQFAGYPEGQLRATLVLCRALAQCFPIEPARVVGHDMVQGQQTAIRGAAGHDKRDVGGWCLDTWRRWMFGVVDHIPNALQLCLSRYVDPAIHDDPTIFDFKLAKQRLHALGYDVNPESESWPQEESDSVGIFQVLMGLQPDGLCGPKTQRALLSRCRDRFLSGGIMAAKKGNDA